MVKVFESTWFATTQRRRMRQKPKVGHNGS